jgi:plastocyanin
VGNRVLGIRLSGTIALALIAMLSFASAASAKDEYLQAVKYPDRSVYSCRTDAIPIYPGQNMNLFGATSTCPHAKKLAGSGPDNPFNSSAQGFVTRFKPSMVELKPSGKLVTPSVWDLHLHHVVWLRPNGGPTFASGEEKTIASMPEGYGLKVAGNGNWLLNYMIHSLNASKGRQVYITWQIDWVPASSPTGATMKDTTVQWMDVAGKHVYPVFDARRDYDLDGDGNFTFPDDVPTDPDLPGYQERENISQTGNWTLNQDRTLVFASGHLHPGGKHVDIDVSRDGPDAGTVPGDTPSETKPIFTSRARYYEPAGPISWDVAMKATRRDWRIALKAGDKVTTHVTYNVSKSSWYESMGIMPLAVSAPGDPAAKDPFDDAADVKAMYDEGGILTHGRLKENIDSHARDDLNLPNPKNLKSGNKLPKSGIKIKGFLFDPGGFSAVKSFPTKLMHPPVIHTGDTVKFTNEDALPNTPDSSQAWHSITSCRVPCNRGSGIGYPLAAGQLDVDSGQLGYGTGLGDSGVTTGSNVYVTPPYTKPGTYTYFCRIHPFMRGSLRVKK